MPFTVLQCVNKDIIYTRSKLQEVPKQTMISYMSLHSNFRSHFANSADTFLLHTRRARNWRRTGCLTEELEVILAELK